MIQSATRIVLVRHGETAWNVDQRVQGQLDIPLNDNGRRQAEQLAERLAGEDLDALYSSDLSRAAETAAAVARRTGLPVVHAPGLRERGFGHLEGFTWRQIEQQHPEAALRWRRRDPGFGPGGGEVLADFYARCVATAAELAARHAGQGIALVSHGGVLDCLYRAATRIALDAPRTWQLGNASINRLLATGEGFTLVGWNDTAHLEKAGRDEQAAS